MASEHNSSGPALHEMTPVSISSGLVPNPPSSTPFIPPSRSDWDLLFQPMFDESLSPPPNVDYRPEVIVLFLMEWHLNMLCHWLTSSSQMIKIAPSPVTLLQKETSKLFISHDVEEDNHDIEVAHMGNDPYFGIYKVSSDELGGCKIRGYRIFLAFAAHMNMVIYQMDVKTAFLNGNMREKLGYESCDQLDTTMWRSPNGMRIKDGKAVIITLSWSFGRDHKLIRTMALDSINSNYCDNTALLPYAATTFNTPDPNI
ncbi:retrovirus-related pol polyprotein from transposon TNT 1-94 [Tanacetum coccineum]